MVRLQSFAPYKNAAHALENANDISEGLPPIFFGLHEIENAVRHRK